ncbi:MAG: sulfotransferase [Casimicrobiaceae bacterium]
MQLPVPFFKLPLQFDAARLAAEVAQFTAAEWRPHPQGHPGNSALPYVARNGNPLDDGVSGPMLPTPHLARCPYVMQVMEALGVTLGRSRLMRLEARAEATPHVDLSYYWQQRVRVHIPVVTFPEVEFICGDATTHMAAGECWIFDTWRVHNVLNPNAAQRTHLVVDTVGSGEFWQRVDAGRDPTQVPVTVPYRAGAKTQLRFERHNYPVVMEPAEMASLWSRWLADARSGDASADAIAAIDACIEPVFRDWRALWAQFGDQADGWPHYTRLRERILAIADANANRAMLPNKMDLASLLQLSLAPALLGTHLATASGAAVGSNAPPHSADAAQIPDLAQSKPQASRKLSVQWGVQMVSRQQAPPPAVARLVRPLIIVSAPRAGSTLLFETLSRAPNVFTVGGESHDLFENIAALRPSPQGPQSNRADASDAKPDIVDELHQRFRAALRDRDGRAPAAGSAPRLLEKTPKNALRVPFLDAAFADAQFVYLYRDPEENVSSMIEGWESGRFVMYARLPDWRGPPWSFLLVPGWRDLIGTDVPAIAAAQWQRTQTALLDDLEALPPSRVHALTYREFLADPEARVRDICRFAELAWDRPLPAALPLSRYTVTPPQADKWRQREAQIAPHRAELERVAERARAFVARLRASSVQRVVGAAP